MFRASSEMVVAISVAPPGENLRAVASERPFSRAATMSRSDLIGTVMFSSTNRGPSHAFVVDLWCR
jgi:hypothetical protein